MYGTGNNELHTREARRRMGKLQLNLIRKTFLSTSLALGHISLFLFVVPISKVSDLLLCTGINQFNHMTLPNAQMSQATMGPRAASPMNHPQQMNINSVPAVRGQTAGHKNHIHTWGRRVT